jgi:hypothetical protein
MQVGIRCTYYELARQAMQRLLGNAWACAENEAALANVAIAQRRIDLKSVRV